MESPEGLTIVWQAPALDSNLVGDGLLLLSCEGAEIDGPEGSPAVPIFRIPIALPQGDWVFSIEIEKWEDAGEADLAPVPVLRGFPDGPYSEHYEKDKLAYSEDRWFPLDGANFSEAGWARNVRLGNLTISPIRYNPLTKRLQRLTELRCSIAHSKGTTARPDRVEKAVLSATANPKSGFVSERPRKRPSQDIFSMSGSWFTFPVTSSGLLKIDRGYLTSLGLNPASVDPSEIRLFDEGWMELPIGNTDELPSLEEIPLYSVGLDDGSFDEGDALYFCARGISGWLVEGTRFSHHLHRFANANYYWISIGGDFPAPAKRLSAEAISGGDTVSTGLFMQFVENDYIYAKTGNDIQWGAERTTSKYITLLDSRIDTSFGAYVRHRLVPVADEDRPVVYARVNGQPPDSAFSIWTGAQQAFFRDAFTKGINAIEIDFGGTSVLFDYYEIIYKIELSEYNGSLSFLGGNVPSTYIVSGFSARPLVFDVTDQTDLRLLSADSIGAGLFAFSDSLAGRQYFVQEGSSARRADLPTARNLTGLRERTFNSDMLMLIPEGLENDLDEYISYRESRGTSVDWVFVEDVMEEFAFGTHDPTAIRDFLRYLWLYSERPPEYIMLVGDATWDPRGITDPPVTYCPAALCVANAPDDFFYAVSSGDGIPDYSGGRVPITTINDWRHFVAKVKNTEGDTDFGPWRTRFVYCADDERKTGDLPDSWQHTTQTSSFVREMPQWTEPRTVYLVDYPLTSIGLKPTAQKALVDYWRAGSQLVNYVGHGNYTLWTHEEAFEATSCVGKLDNKRKLPLVISASCEVGLFYRTIGQAIAEQVVLYPEAGAFAAVAATRMTLSPSNGTLNSRLLNACWNQGQKTTLGPALIYAKGGDTYTSTRGQYVLFGDPAMEIGPPNLDIVLSIDPDSLLAGRKISLTGEVHSDSGLVEDFNGRAYILVYDSGYFKNYSSPYLSGSVTYYEGGKRLFSGPVDVAGGRFSAEFVVPIDISYGTNGGKVVAYAYNDAEEAVGFVSELVVDGDTSLTINDSIGPVVSLSIDGPGFGDRGVLCGGGTLICTVSDENGINLSGGAGHILTMTIDGNEAGAVDLSQNFEYFLNSYQAGQASYDLGNLAVGMHIVAVKAWDNMGNSGTAELSFEVSDCDIEISNALAYPNPFTSGTDITFNIGAAASATVSIFTLTGRPVRKLESTVSPAFASIYWDGEDSKGTPVANGTYIVKIEARSADGKTDDKLIKIAKLR